MVFFLARNDDLYKAKLVWDAIEFNYDFGFAYGGHHLIEHLIELKKRAEDDYAKKVFDFIDGKCGASQVNEFACSVFEECNNDPVKLGIAYELYSMAASASLRDAHDSKCYLEEIVLNDKPNEKNFWKKWANVMRWSFFTQNIMRENSSNAQTKRAARVGKRENRIDVASLNR